MATSSPVVYRADPKTRGGMRFVDVWGLGRKDLETLRGVQLVIGKTSWDSFTVMLKVGETKAGVDDLVSRYGAVSFETVPKSH